jgi:hypothetical protein
MTYLKKKQVMLALVIVLSVPAPSPANATADIFGAMFRMMLVMMNAMSDSMLGNNNNTGWGSASPLGMGMTTLPMMSGMYGMNPMTGLGGMSPWSGMNSMPMNGMSPWSGMNTMPMNGMSPWSTPFNSWSNPFTNAYPSYANNPYGNRQYGGYYAAPQGSFLDGRWYGSAGEVLEVRGNRFRLLDVQAGINGAIRIENNIVSLYSPQTGTVTQYSFIRNRSGLILQDATGRVLSFRLRPDNYGSYSF